MGRPTNSFARGVARFRPQPTILIICEDKVSSHDYLKKAAQHFRASAIVEVDHCGKTDPQGIAENALRRCKDYERVYCVVDRDSHKNFHAAIKIVADSKKNVELIISNPCFEYWIIIHFNYTRKGYTSMGAASSGAQALKELTSIKDMSDYEKGNAGQLFERLLPRLETAERHAARSLADAVGCGEFNPSTQMHLLIQQLRKLAAPQPI